MADAPAKSKKYTPAPGDICTCFGGTGLCEVVAVNGKIATIREVAYPEKKPCVVWSCNPKPATLADIEKKRGWEQRRFDAAKAEYDSLMAQYDDLAAKLTANAKSGRQSRG